MTKILWKLLNNSHHIVACKNRKNPDRYLTANIDGQKSFIKIIGKNYFYSGLYIYTKTSGPRKASCFSSVFFVKSNSLVLHHFSWWIDWRIIYVCRKIIQLEESPQIRREGMNPGDFLILRLGNRQDHQCASFRKIPDRTRLKINSSLLSLFSISFYTQHLNTIYICGICTPQYGVFTLLPPLIKMGRPSCFN